MGEASLKYDGTVNTSSKGTAILGRLTGPCADVINSTRNGRKYSQKLWEKVFKDPIVTEYFNCGGVFGELNHPADREETDLTKVCICMPEPPKKNSTGELIGSWDILDTPNGRILKCLCDYGYKIGISSRGSGDTYIDENGEEAVDPDSYNFQGFDIVYLPAVKSARLQYESINESFNPNESKPNFRTALQEQFKRSNDDERRVMAETLKDLKIDYFPSKVNNSSSKIMNEAANSRSDIMMELQKVLRENKGLKNEITSLKEQLSVCYAKDTEVDNNIENYKSTIAKLSESLKSMNALKEKNSSLIEKINSIQDDSSNKAKLLNEQLNNEQIAKNSLLETINSNKKIIDDLNNKNNSLKEQLAKSKEKAIALEENYIKCRESLSELKKDISIKNTDFQNKNSEDKRLIEQYKKIARRAVEKYIENQADKLGVDSSEIKDRLSENYSFEEIDRVCENLQAYVLNIGKLPFSTANYSNKNSSNIKMSLNESCSKKYSSDYDDCIDDSLIALAGL